MQAVAAYSGIAFDKINFDYGMDAQLKDIICDNNGFRESGYNIDVQLKSTSNFIIKNNKIVYDLESKNYNDLVLENVITPRILVLLLLPKQKSDWLDVSEEFLLLKKSAFWCSLKGNKKTENKQKKRIQIPTCNILTPDNLKELMAKIKRGDDL